MSRFTDWLFNRSIDDGSEQVKKDADAGLLDGDGPKDVAEVEAVEYDEC